MERRRDMRTLLILAALLHLDLAGFFSRGALAQPLPFESKIEVYRAEEGDILVFALFLEQPFLAEEFERSDYLRLLPVDQYLLHFGSMAAARQLVDLADRWGRPIVRLYTVRSREHNLGRKYEEQLCLDWDGLDALFADGVVTELGVTGSDFFLGEGSDVTLILRVKGPDRFEAAAAGWLEATRKRHPDLVERCSTTEDIASRPDTSATGRSAPWSSAAETTSCAPTAIGP
jgi:hypothetical protein